MDDPNILDKVVYYEAWSAELIRGLRFWGVRTWRDLCSLGEAHLLILPGVGRGQVNFVKAELAKVGLKFEGWRGTASGRDAPARLPPSETAIVCGVYFIRCGPFIKIGFGANIAHRLLAVQLANPIEVELVGFIPCDDAAQARTLERQLHQRFAGSRHRLEWFRITEELCALLAESEQKTLERHRHVAQDGGQAASPPPFPPNRVIREGDLP